MRPPSSLGTVVRLGTTQTLAWASSYYLPAMLAAPMADDLGVTAPTVFAAFSLALIVSALLGPLAGHAIDQHGGRPVLLGTNVLFAISLLGLGIAQGPASLFAAWVLMGVAMGSGLYEAAFATLVRLYGPAARGAITGVTLFAGFASSVGWPLSAWMENEFGWRGACFGWAALHLLLGLPLNAWLPCVTASPTPQSSEATDVPLPQVTTIAAARQTRSVRRSTMLLAFVFAITWFISTAMAAHLPRLLQASGITLLNAVAVSALVGPAQVVARLLEFGFLSRLNPITSARLAAIGHPMGAALLILLGGPAAVIFTVLHGAGNGILTIAKGTLPLVLFGPAGYGMRQGLMMVPARIAQAVAPVLFGLLLDTAGTLALWLTTALGLMASAALWMLHAPRHKS